MSTCQYVSITVCQYVRMSTCQWWNHRFARYLPALDGGGADPPTPRGAPLTRDKRKGAAAGRVSNGCTRRRSEPATCRSEASSCGVTKVSSGTSAQPSCAPNSSQSANSTHPNTFMPYYSCTQSGDWQHPLRVNCKNSNNLVSSATCMRRFWTLALQSRAW